MKILIHKLEMPEGVIETRYTDEGVEEDVGACDVTLFDVFNGIGIKTDQGLFGIAQRDAGIEVMLDGTLVWSSGSLALGNTITPKLDRILALLESKSKPKVVPGYPLNRPFKTKISAPSCRVEVDTTDCPDCHTEAAHDVRCGERISPHDPRAAAPKNADRICPGDDEPGIQKCPGCGNAQEFAMVGGGVYVACRDCLISGPVLSFDAHTMGVMRCAAITGWNAVVDAWNGGFATANEK